MAAPKVIRSPDLPLYFDELAHWRQANHMVATGQVLQDNVVTILQTVREMTQPEVMALVRRTAETAQGTDEEFATPPSAFALLRQMRDPEVRRGLARVMAMLQTVGATANTPPVPTVPAAHD